MLISWEHQKLNQTNIPLEENAWSRKLTVFTEFDKLTAYKLTIPEQYQQTEVTKQKKIKGNIT